MLQVHWVEPPPRLVRLPNLFPYKPLRLSTSGRNGIAVRIILPEMERLCAC